MSKPEQNQKPISNGKFFLMSALMLAFAGAVAVGDYEVNKMQDADPVFVINSAQKQIEDLGYSNVKFSTFNKAAEKPAHVTFSADKQTSDGILHYKGTGDCSAMACSKVSVTLNMQNPFTPYS